MTGPILPSALPAPSATPDYPTATPPRSRRKSRGALTRRKCRPFRPLSGMPTIRSKAKRVLRRLGRIRPSEQPALRKTFLFHEGKLWSSSLDPTEPPVRQRQVESQSPCKPLRAHVLNGGLFETDAPRCGRRDIPRLRIKSTSDRQNRFVTTQVERRRYQPFGSNGAFRKS